MTFAFFFESVGGGEWLVLLAVVLIVVGPKNLPGAARKIGEIMSQLRRAADEFKRQLMSMDQDVRSAVADVKQDYMSIGQEVQDTVADDGTSNPPDDSSYPDGSDPSADASDGGDDEDRAIWESYGRDYDDPDGIYGDHDEESDGGTSGTGTAEASSELFDEASVSSAGGPDAPPAPKKEGE